MYIDMYIFTQFMIDIYNQTAITCESLIYFHIVSI